MQAYAIMSRNVDFKASTKQPAKQQTHSANSNDNLRNSSKTSTSWEMLAVTYDTKHVRQQY